MSVPITKFSVRLYGSEMAVQREQKRQMKSGRFVIHPYSSFRFYWDVVSLILLIVSMFVIPIAITFFSESLTVDPGWIAFNLCLDCWFFADILMNFHTGIIEDSGDEEVILDLPTIRRRYLRSWFSVDMVSSLPIDYLLQCTSVERPSASASRAVKLFRFAKIVSLLRLLRISRLIRYVHQWEQVIVGLQYDLAVAAVRIFNLVCLMLLIGHLNGCLQFMVPMLNDYPADSWIEIDNLRNKTWAEQYSWCLFKAMSHMLCIGYGQKPPQNITDLWMTMLSMVSGAVCFAMFIGNATALIQSMDSSERQYKEKYMQVKEYLRFRHLPKATRKRVYDYYENRFQGKMFDEQGILNELSESLREEIVNFNCRHLVDSVPFFKDTSSDFVTAVVQKLKYEVFQPKDVIVKEGTVGKKMYFIQHGLVDVHSSQRPERLKQLSDGSFFGEICLIATDRRVASVIAATYCSTYSLHADDMKEIFDEYPMMKDALQVVACKRLELLGPNSATLNKSITSLDKGTSLAAEQMAHKIELHDKHNCLNLQRNMKTESENSSTKESLSVNTLHRSTSTFERMLATLSPSHRKKDNLRKSKEPSSPHTQRSNGLTVRNDSKRRRSAVCRPSYLGDLNLSGSEKRRRSDCLTSNTNQHLQTAVSDNTSKLRDNSSSSPLSPLIKIECSQLSSDVQLGPSVEMVSEGTPRKMRLPPQYLPISSSLNNDYNKQSGQEECERDMINFDTQLNENDFSNSMAETSLMFPKSPNSCKRREDNHRRQR